MKPPEPASTYVDKIHAVLKEAIVSMDITPGSKLSISGLSIQHSVSLGVVREALTRLAADGLVTSSAMQGFRVIGISEKSLRELTEVRLLIMGEAMRQSIAKADLAWEARIISSKYMLQRIVELAQRDAGSVRQIDEAVSEFEHALIAGCPNQHMLMMFEMNFEATRIYKRLAISVMFGEREHIIQELQEAAEKALAREPDAVMKLLRRQADVIIARCKDVFQNEHAIEPDVKLPRRQRKPG